MENAYIKEMLQELEEKESIKREMLLNDSYIKWLEHFTEKFQDFNHNSWLYSPEEISKEEYNNVIKIIDFYEIIDKYACRNYIYPNKTKSGNYYLISYNDVLYNIYVIAGQGTVFGCNRIEGEKDIDFNVINYASIKENKDSEKKIFIDKKIKKLSKQISELIKVGVPIEAIDECIKKFKISNI